MLAERAGASTGAAEPHQVLGPDTTRPDVRMTSAAKDPARRSPITVWVLFSEPVTGFVATDVTVTNARLRRFTMVDAQTYTFALFPKQQGRVTADIAAKVAKDGTGNGNRAAPGFRRRYIGPTAR